MKNSQNIPKPPTKTDDQTEHLQRQAEVSKASSVTLREGSLPLLGAETSRPHAALRQRRRKITPAPVESSASVLPAVIPTPKGNPTLTDVARILVIAAARAADNSD